jgi:hypothetical protein
LRAGAVGSHDNAVSSRDDNAFSSRDDNAFSGRDDNAFSGRDDHALRHRHRTVGRGPGVRTSVFRRSGGDWDVLPGRTESSACAQSWSRGDDDGPGGHDHDHTYAGGRGHHNSHSSCRPDDFRRHDDAFSARPGFLRRNQP